jgi:hypothetical protein
MAHILHVDAGKTQRALKATLNGDVDTMEPAARRGLTTLAQEQDEHHVADIQVHYDLGSALEQIGKRQTRLFGVLFTVCTTGFTVLGYLVQVT